MGNLLPLDGAKKEQIEEIAQEFLGTFTTEYILSYGTEFAKMKLKQIDNETYATEERKKKLMYRKKPELSDAHKEGMLTKKGAIIKNWKKRYFVVRPDYTVHYYENEDAYYKELKPKGVIQLAGYKVEENADDAAMEKLKKLAKLLGIDEGDIPSADKFPDNTLELMHERRRSYFITAADDQERKDWVKMFQLCCDKSCGFTNKDPVAQAAFKSAYRSACRQSNHYVRNCGGTEQQILSETIAEIINNRVLSSTYSGLTGNFMIKRKIKDQVMKTLDSLVLASVTPSYKAMTDTTQSMKVPLEKNIDEKKDEIVNVQKQVTQQLSEKLESIVTKAVEEAVNDIKKMFDELKQVAERAQQEMRTLCVVGLIEILINEANKSQTLEATIKDHFKRFDKVVGGLTSWKYWYKVYGIEQEYMKIIRSYESTFEYTGGYNSVYLSHDILSQVADAAFFTFEESFRGKSEDKPEVLKENEKTTEVMKTIKDDVLQKYDYDSEIIPEEITFQNTTDVVVHYVSSKIDPLTKDIRKSVASLIPEPLSKIVSVQDRYELYIEESVKDLVRKAVGLVKPKPTTKQDDELNGNDKKSMEKIDEKDTIEKNEKKVKEEMNNEEEKENGNKEKKLENDLNKKEVDGEMNNEKEKEDGNREENLENDLNKKEVDGEMNNKEEKEDGNKEESLENDLNKKEVDGEMNNEKEKEDGNREENLENNLNKKEVGEEMKTGEKNEVKNEENIGNESTDNVKEENTTM